MTARRPMSFVVLLCLVLAACGDDEAATSDTGPDTTTSVDTSTVEETTTTADVATDVPTPDAADDVAAPSCPPTGATGTKVGDTAGNLSLVKCDGTPFELHSLCGAEATLVFLYHGWCAACNDFLDRGTAEALHQSYQSLGLEYVFIIAQDMNGEPPTSEYCKAVQEEAGLTMTVVYDPQGETLAYGTNSHFMVLDEEDVIVYSHKFNIPLALEAIEAELADLPLAADVLVADQLTADFTDGTFDGAGFWSELVGSDSSVEVREGVAVVTASDVGGAFGAVRAGLRTDPKFGPKLKAIEADVRIAQPSSDGKSFVEVAGLVFNTGLYPEYEGVGAAGAVTLALRLNENRKVTAILFQCTNPRCSAPEPITVLELGTEVDTSAWHKFAIGCDATKKACYARWGDQPVVTIPVTEDYPFPDPTWRWGFGAARAISPSGSAVEAEVDNIKAGSLVDIFGAIE